MNEKKSGLLGNPIVTGVATALIVSAVLGGWALLTRRLSEGRQRGHPLEVSVENDIEGFDLALPGALPPGAKSLRVGTSPYDWLRERGAADIGETSLRLTFHGLSDETVVVRDIRVEVLKRASAVSYTAVRCPSAGESEVIPLLYDLDARRPTARRWSEEKGRVDEAPYFRAKNITVKKGETQDVNVLAKAERDCVRWRLAVDVQVGPEKRTIVLPGVYLTSGEPAGGFKSEFEWDLDGQKLVPKPSR